MIGRNWMLVGGAVVAAALAVAVVLGTRPAPPRLEAETPPAAGQVPTPDCGRPLAGQVVVVDPGHGRDPISHNYTGDHGVNGAWEDVNVLDVGRRLLPLLQASGATAYITRGDYDPGPPPLLGLVRRVRFAAAHHATVFVSIHQNNSARGHPSEHGVETFWWRPNSRRLAEVMQRALVAGTGLADHGVVRQPFYVLRFGREPAILIEGGFLSNPQEAQLISTPDFHQREAQAIRDGLVAYVAPACAGVRAGAAAGTA
jgi:N-acetylmuramoyl-L-alanine amidase